MFEMYVQNERRRAIGFLRCCDLEKKSEGAFWLHLQALYSYLHEVKQLVAISISWNQHLSCSFCCPDKLFIPHSTMRDT